MSDKSMQTRPAVVQAFVPGARAHDQVFGDMTFWARSAGDLIAPTGRIVACDPLYCIGAPAFVREVPPGRYPVLLALAQFTQDGDERTAAAMLRLRDVTPVHWELATMAYEPGEGEIDGAPIADNTYCVDSALGGFMDEVAIRALQQQIAAEDDEDYLPGLLEALDWTGSAEWFDIPLDEDTGANMLLFASGWGDGTYSSYWGYAADDSPVCLLTDFGVVDDADFLTVAPPDL
ncbi:MAG TPA: DUF4241 domain-containing protein [Ktedonobacterales bacterium]